MSADMLTGMPGLDGSRSAARRWPRQWTPGRTPPWFADGATLAKKVPGKGVLTVAALGPRLPARELSDTDHRVLSSRAYELRRGSGHWVGSVVEVGGKAVCASVSAADPGRARGRCAARSPAG